MSESYLPSARRDKLLVRELADEVLVYDEESHRAHCLNRTAALVWRHCDGKTSAPEIAGRIGGRPPSPLTEEVVWLAFEALAEKGLLTTAAARPPGASPISRRKMMRRMGVAAAAALPLITSIVSPTPAQAQSPCTETSCPPGTTCQAGVCEPDGA